MKNSALVVIDLQNDITKNYREIIENVNTSMKRLIGPLKRNCGLFTYSTTTCLREREHSGQELAAQSWCQS